jgi:hypothetical protein
MGGEEHLTTEQVERILEIVEDADAVVVGGQSLNLWVRHYGADRPEFAGQGPFTSKDLDFYRNEAAAVKLADALVDGEVLRPGPEDATPNAAVVVGMLGDRSIEVDFMNTVLGVDERSIQNNFVTLSGTTSSGKNIHIMLLHPIDTLRSRLANVNVLGRNDDHSVRQARAAIKVSRFFIDDLLRYGDTKRAQSMLHDMQYVTREHCMRRPAFEKHGLDTLPVMRAFLADERLDERWRTKVLAHSVERLEAARLSLSKAEVPDYPKDTHNHKTSPDGRNVVVRAIDPSTGAPGKVDNPVGPAMVTPSGPKWLLDGVEFSEQEWRDQPRVTANLGAVRRL